MSKKSNHKHAQSIAVQEMGPETARVAKTIYRLQRKAAEGCVLIDYDIGVLIRRTRIEEGTFELDAVEQIARYANRRGGVVALHRLRNMVDVFTREAVQHEVNQPMVDGRFLETGHFLALSEVRSPGVRRQLLERTRAECLSVRKLTAIVRQHHSQRLGIAKPGR